MSETPLEPIAEQTEDQLAVERAVQHCNAVFNYEFRDPTLVMESMLPPLTPASILGQRNVYYGCSRLHQVGSAALGLVAFQQLWQTVGTPAQISAIANPPSNLQYFAAFARSHELGSFIVCTAEDRKDNFARHPEVLTRTVVALVGAIYIDSSDDMEAVRRAVEGRLLTAPL